MTEQDRARLVRCIASRGPDAGQAMARLYRDFGSRVCAFVRRRLRTLGEYEVQAVTAATMYQVWCSAPSFNGGSAIDTWILGIARHELLDSAREHRRHFQRHLDIDDFADTLADPNADVEDRIAERQRVEWLVDCAGTLPAPQRESLHLLLVEGMSVEQIAQAHGCAVGTVKTRIFHAKARLRSGIALRLAHEHAGAGAAALRPASESSPARR